MSYLTPPLGNRRPTEALVHQASVPSASVSDALRNDVNRNAQFSNPIANAVHHDLMKRSNSFSSQVLQHGRQLRPTDPNGLRTHSKAHADYPTYPPSPITPKQAPECGAVTRSVHRPHPMAAQKDVPLEVNLSYEALNTVVGSYDERILARLAALESSLRTRIERTFSHFSDVLNSSLAEVKDGVAKKLDAHVLEAEQKRAWSTENLRVDLDSWKAAMIGDTKIAMQEAVEEAVKKVGDGVLKQVNALGRLGISLGEKAGERHNVISSDLKDVQSTGAIIQSHLNSLDARIKSIEDIASSYISAPLPTRSLHHTPSSLAVIPPLSQLSIPAETPASNSENITHLLTSFKSYFTERMSQVDDTLVQLAKMITAARDEAHSGKEELAAMLENSHVLQTTHLKSLQNEVHTLKTAIGVIDPAKSASEVESAEDRSSTGVNPEETSSLVERMQALEKNQHIIMKHFESSLTVEQGLTREASSTGEFGSVCSKDQFKSSYSSISPYFDVSASAMQLLDLLRRLGEGRGRKREHSQDEAELVKRERKPNSKQQKFRLLDHGRDRSGNKSSVSPNDNKKDFTVEKRETRFPSPSRLSGPSSSRTLSTDHDVNIGRIAVTNGAHSDVGTSDAESDSDEDFPSGEALLASRTKERNVCSPLTASSSYTGGEHTPSYFSAAAARNSRGTSTAKSGENEARRTKPHESQVRRKEDSQKCRLESLSVRPDTHAHATKRIKLTDSSAIMKFAERKPRGTRKRKTEPEPGNQNPLPSQPAQPSASSSQPQHRRIVFDSNTDVPRKRDKSRLVKIDGNGQAIPTASRFNAHTDTPSPPNIPTEKSVSTSCILSTSISPSRHTGVGEGTGVAGYTWPKKVIGNEVFDRQLIQCDKCNNHYHYRCVGVKEGDDAIKIPNVPFMCPLCSEITAESSRRGAEKVKAQPRCCRPDCDWLGAQDIFVVDKILGRALSDPEDGRERYFFWLVKWAGYPASCCRWQIAEHIGGADKLIQDFHAAAEKEGLNHRSHDLLILKEAIDGGYRIPIEGV